MAPNSIAAPQQVAAGPAGSTRISGNSQEHPMSQNTTRIAGRHFLQIPGPSPVPDRILRAMDRAIIDHRGPEFQRLAKRVLDGVKAIFKCSGPVVIYTATGTGAWEGALVNTLSPGDRVLMCNTGHFATLWRNMAKRLGLEPEFIDTDWRIGADLKVVEAHLRKDAAHKIKAVCVLHNETSTGCLSPIAEIRQAIDAVKHPALFFVDTISSLASTEYRHDDWGVDVSIGGAQKGLMLPPGMSFNAVGTSFRKLAGRYFRIGHLGDTNDLTILGALASVEMALALAGVPHRKGGVQAAMDYLVSAARTPARAAAE